MKIFWVIIIIILVAYLHLRFVWGFRIYPTDEENKKND